MVMQQGNMRPGDWMCPACKNHNYANKMACNMCSFPKPGGNGSFGFQGTKGGYGAMKGAQKFQQQRSAPYQAAPASTGAMQPGDWCCPSCGNHNYASKMACNRCKVPKMDAMFGGMGGMMTSKMGGMMTTSRPGDWKCHACGNLNYASRESCNRKGCGIPKASFISKAGLRPGDWLCTMCGNHNYSGKVECKKCSAPMGNATMITTQAMKPGDWLCPKCSNHNYKDRLTCNRCNVSKAMLPAHSVIQA